MPVPDRKTALITGASFGIGLELARIFAREGYNLVLVARSADKLRQLASELEKAHGTRSLILAVDLTEPGAPAYVLDQTTRADIQVNVLVNNAGIGQYGWFAENDLEECLRQIQLNVTTLTHLTRLYLPAMIERAQTKRESGRIPELSPKSRKAIRPCQDLKGEVGAHQAILAAISDSQPHRSRVWSGLRQSARRRPARDRSDARSEPLNCSSDSPGSC